MPCQIRYKEGQIDQVLAPNGETSTLFNNIKKEFKVSNPYALRLWAQTYTPSFKSLYEGKYDRKGEPILNDAKHLLHSFADEVRLSEDFESRLKKVAELYNMDKSGYLPMNTEISRLKASLRKHGITGVSVKMSTNGRPYITVGGAFYNPHTSHYYQSLKDAPLRDFRVAQALNELMRQFGIEVEWTDNLADNIIGRADVTNRLIELAEGKAKLSDVTEEMTHMIVAMMRGTPTYYAMMNAIKDFPAYEEVKENYSQQVNYSDPQAVELAERKAKEEAIVKHLNDILLEGEDLTWWERVLAWLRRVFNNPAAVDTFRKVAGDILKQDVGALQLDYNNTKDFDWESTSNLDDVWYSINPIPERQARRISQLQAMSDAKVGMEGDRYKVKVNGQEMIIKLRVNDIVQKHARHIFGYLEHAPLNKELYITKGTILHTYMEIIMQAYIRAESTAITVNKTELENAVYSVLKNDPDFTKFDKEYFKLTAYQLKEIISGLEHFYNSITQQDENAKILTEQFVFNPERPEGSLGGTIDVLVVHGDGTVSMYDYKNVRLKRDGRTGYVPVSDKKMQLYDTQIGQYKKMLMDTLGLSRHDFRQTRIIPINVQYKDGKIKTLQMSRPGLNKAELDKLTAELKEKNIKKPYLTSDYVRPIVAGEEVSFDDPDLNVFIEKLYIRRSDLRSQLKRARTKSDKTRIERKIDRLNNIVNNILVYQDLQQPLESLKLMVHSINNNITKYDAQSIMNALSSVEMLEAFHPAFKNTLDEMKDPATKEVYKKLMDEYNGLLVQAKSSLEQEIINRASMLTGDDYNTPMNQKKILKGGRQKDIVGRYLEGAGTFNEPVLKAIMKLITEAEEKARLSLMNKEREINRVTDEYIKWAKANGYGGIDNLSVFDLMLDDNRNIVSVFKKEFYQTRLEMIRSGLEKYRNREDYSKELSWLKEHMVFNQEAWNEWYDKRKAEIALSDMTKREAKRELDYLMSFNPNVNDLAYFQQNNGFLRRPKDHSDPIMTEYVSDKYKEIRKHKEASAFYDMWRETVKEIGNSIGWDLLEAGEFTVPNLRASTVEHYGNMLSAGLAGAFRTGWQGALEIRENDHVFGSIDTETGEPTMRIPIPYLDKIVRELTPSEKTEIEEQVKKDGFKEDTRDYLDEVERRTRRKKEEKGVLDKSKDLGRALKLWYGAVMEYKFKKDIEHEVLMVKEVLNTDFYKEQGADKFGRDLFNWHTSQAAEKQGASEATKGTVDKFIRAHLYGQNVQGRDVLFRDKYSATKAIQTLHSFLSAKALGLNPVLAGASALNAMYNRKIMGEREIYFSKESFKEAVNTALTSDPKSIRAVLFFEPADKKRDRALKTSAAQRVKFFSGRNLFILHRGGGKKFGSGQRELREAGYQEVDDPFFGDDAVANKILLAMMRHWVIDSDGKVRSKGDPFNPPKDPNAKTIWEAFQDTELLKEDFEWSENNIPVEGLSFEEYNRFRRIVAEAQNKVKGTQSTDTYNQMGMTIWGQALQKFRTWMPGLVANRWEALRENPILESYTEGYFRGAIREFLPSIGYIRAEQEGHATAIATVFKLLTETVGNGLVLLAEAASMGLYKQTINRERAAFFRNRLLAKNPDLHPNTFTLEAFIEYRQKSVRAFVREVRIYAGVIALISLILNSMGWDDDEENNVATRFLYRLAVRTRLELGFFFGLKSVTEIIDSPVAAWRLVKDFSRWTSNMTQESAELIGLLPYNKRDRTPLGYYTLKQVPGVNQVLSLINFFPAYKEQKGTLEKIFEESRFFEGQSISRR